MNKTVQTADLYPIIEEKLSFGGSVELTPKGKSMLPLINPKIDKVIITPKTQRVKKYDIVLYRRDDGSFVIHRVIKVKGDGSYVLCGDAQYDKEHGITDKNIIGQVKQLKRNGTVLSLTGIKYRLYCFFRVNTISFRRGLKRRTSEAKFLMTSIRRKLFHKNG